MSVQTELQRIFEAELGLPAEEFGNGLKYGETPEWDSASHMMVIMAIEERFEVAFDSDEIVEMTTVPKIVAVLVGKDVVDP